jgi:hypothetical protein
MIISILLLLSFILLTITSASGTVCLHRCALIAGVEGLDFGDMSSKLREYFSFNFLTEIVANVTEMQTV